MIICKVCNIDNSEDSKFCIECGVGLGNGEPSKIKGFLQVPKNIDTKIIKKEMEKWKNNPWHIPILSAPTKSLENIMFEKHPIAKQPVINPIDEKIKTIAEETRLDLNNPKEYGVFTNIKQVKEAKNKELKHTLAWSSNTTEFKMCGMCFSDRLVFKYTSPKPLKCVDCNWLNPDHPDNEQCGKCGTVNCEIEHLSTPPPIQQQYQEAFENIQKIRKNRYVRNILKKYGQAYILNNGRPEWLQSTDKKMNEFILDLIGDIVIVKELSITRTDVRKGIRPRKSKPPIKSYPTKAIYK